MNADLESRLENWGRWAKASGARGSCSASLEGNWRSPQRYHWAEPVHAVQMPIDHQDALVIERAVSQADPLNRIVLRGRYVWSATPGAMLRMLRKVGHQMAAVKLEAMLCDARTQVAHRLARPVSHPAMVMALDMMRE